MQPIALSPAFPQALTRLGSHAYGRAILANLSLAALAGSAHADASHALAWLRADRARLFQLLSASARRPGSYGAASLRASLRANKRALTACTTAQRAFATGALWENS